MSSLFVGDLHPEVTEAMLYEKFSAIGPVLYIRVCRDLVTHRSLGCAYVKYLLVGDTERAMDALNLVVINGKAMRIMRTRQDPSLRNSGVGNIFIKNLAKSIDSKSLYDTFSVFGKILSCKVLTDENGPRAFGFVHFEKSEAARRAIAKMDGTWLKGTRVFIGQLKPRNEKEAELRAQANRFTDLYIKNLGDAVDDECLKEVFGKFGTVLTVRVVTDDTGTSKGFGFVTFEDSEAARRAVKDMHGQFLNGNRLCVGVAGNRAETQSEGKCHPEPIKQGELAWCKGANLYVKNLEDGFDEGRLRREFSRFGTVSSARVMMDAGRSRGFGFVCYTSPEEAAKAIKEMNGKIVVTKPLYVAIAQSKKERQALLAKDYMDRMAVRGGGDTGLNAHKAATSADFPPIVPRPQCGGAHPRKRAVRAKPHPSQNTHYAKHASATDPRPPSSAFRSPKAPKAKSASQTTSASAKTVALHPRPSAAGPHANQKFENVSGVTCVGVPLQFPAGRPESIPKPAPVHTQGHLSNIYVLASAITQKKLLGEKLFPLVQCVHPALTGEISGILLEMDDAEILHMLKYPESLRAEIDEAILNLQSHQA
ncbi:polyadenylate-binding protein 4-like [Pteronotus mesoamericanus]|uniref:polyadenylate-binding protein 4-like n=1 Tax=Pteronotus mesoamericanus TaxID=1884717 RepID=UPI0023EC1ED0|nr:polyadenylate-binding protein 4-like [Pteronotus parnellii mesoamericanus]